RDGKRGARSGKPCAPQHENAEEKEETPFVEHRRRRTRRVKEDHDRRDGYKVPRRSRQCRKRIRPGPSCHESATIFGAPGNARLSEPLVATRVPRAGQLFKGCLLAAPTLPYLEPEARVRRGRRR